MDPLIAVAWPKPDYLSALARAGARVRIVDPSTDDPNGVLETCDGLLLTGGVDVDPHLYGRDDVHATVEIDAARDRYELPLAQGALALGVPTLAICRGIQLLNVAAGGTLYEDLPTEHPSDVAHRIKEPKDALAHSIRVMPNTRLSQTLVSCTPAGGSDLVNSRHHQAIKDLAPGFDVSAVAPDGVIEGIERPVETFCLGVQWHPENFWESGRFAELFRALAVAASEHRARRPSPRAAYSGTSRTP